MCCENKNLHFRGSNLLKVVLNSGGSQLFIILKYFSSVLVNDSLQADHCLPLAKRLTGPSSFISVESISAQSNKSPIFY